MSSLGPAATATGVLDEEQAAAAPSSDVKVPEFDIVPKRMLILTAMAFAAVIAAIASNKLWPLTFLHVAGGAGWTVIDLFGGFVLGPIVRAMPLQARLEFLTRFMPRMLVLLPTIVTVTLTAGWQFGVKTGTVLSSYPEHGWVIASFIIVGVMTVVSLGLLSPANVGVLVELKKPKPSAAVVQRLTNRFIYCARIIGLMQVATLVIMTKLSASG